MKFGINTLLYAATFTDENLDIFQTFKKLGFNGVEIALEKKGDLDYKRTLNALRENGLECSSICGLFGPNRDLRGPDRDYIQNSISYIRDCIDACVKLGCDVMVGPSYSAVGRANLESEEAKREQWKTAVKSFREVCMYAGDNGVFIALEPLNRFETDFINICADAKRLIEDVGSDRLKIHLDTFHMGIEEKDSGRAVREAGELLYHVHAS